MISLSKFARGRGCAVDPLGLFRAAVRVALALLALNGLLYYLFWQADGAYEIDGWFILNEGRYILEHGIPYINHVSLDAGRGLVVQQWLHDVFAYLVYAAGGFDALAWLQAALFALIAALCVLACRYLSRGRATSDALIALSVCAMALAGFYINVRPTCWTMSALVGTVCACAGFRSTYDRRALVPVPFMALALANLHASMASVVPLAALSFALPPARLLKAPDRGVLAAHLRRTAPLFIAVAASIAALFVNPYGADGVLYVFRGYSHAAAGDLIQEMRPGLSSMSESTSVLFFVAVLAVPAVLLLLAALSDRAGLLDDPVVPPLVALYVAGCVGYAAAFRNIWIAALAGMLLSARLAPYAWPDAVAKSSAAVSIMPLVALPVAILFATSSGLNPMPAEKDFATYDSDLDAVADLCIAWREEKGRDPKIYSTEGRYYNYLSWRGLKVPFDLRPEIWSSDVSGPGFEDTYKVWSDAEISGSIGDYVREGGFDLLVLDAEEDPDVAGAVHGEVLFDNGFVCLVSPAGGDGEWERR